MSTNNRQRLGDLAKVLRSKNAGPFMMTFDIIFDQPVVYEKIKQANLINPATIARLYALEDPTEIRIVAFDQALAIKVTLPRPLASGDVGDSDIYGAQQHAPLYNLVLS
jgi:hypothetical protein